MSAPAAVSIDRTAWWRWASLGVVPAVLGLVSLTRGLRPEHVLAGLLFVVLAWVGPRARRFSWLALPFVLTGLAYDHFGALLGLRGEVHVADVYRAELSLFSVTTASGVRTLPEYFSAHHSPWLDALTGFAYMTYMLEAFVIAAYLYFRDAKRMSRLAWAFFLCNLIGMVVWLTFPAAPPWYVIQHGLGPADLGALPSAAGAARFDDLLGIHFFAGFYERNVNVFGAMPSLHTAYPVVVAGAVWTMGRRWQVGTVAFAALVGFSAVYLSHHYVLDVLFGAVTGLVSYAAVTQLGRLLASRPRHTTTREALA